MNEQNEPSEGLVATPRSSGGWLRDETIYERVYAAIVEHRVPPGTKLPEDALAEAFGVSRTKIRKVLHRLAHENIVALRRNRGASVAKPSVAESREVFAARRILEAGTVAAIVRVATPAQVSKLRAFIALERAAYERRDRREAIKLSGQFHLKIAEILGNRILTDFLRELVSRTSLILAVYETHGGTGCPFDEHNELVDLICARDAEATAARMEKHLRGIEESLSLDGVPPRKIDLREVFSQLGSRIR